MLTVTYIVMLSLTAIIDIFIRSKSHHCLALSVILSLLSHCSFQFLLKLLDLSQLLLNGFLFQLLHEFLYVVTWTWQKCHKDFPKLLYGLVKINTWISLNCYTDFSKNLHGLYQSCYLDLLKFLHSFVKVVFDISCHLPNKTKLKLDQDFKVCKSFCFELNVLNKSNYSMPWVRCAL